MATKFAEFIQSNKIEGRRILIASRQIERLRPEDRALKMKKKKGEAASAAPAPAPVEGDAKSTEGKEGETASAEAPPALPKPRSGRTVTSQLVIRATDGKKISGPAKHRLLRAVNRVLEQGKKDPVELRALF